MIHRVFCWLAYLAFLAVFLPPLYLARWRGKWRGPLPEEDGP